MTDDALDKRLTQIEHEMRLLKQQMEHMEATSNLRFERTVTRSEFYWGLLVQASLLAGVMGMMLGLFGYGGQP